MNGRETRNSVEDVWGPQTPYEGLWPSRVDQRVSAEPEQWIQSACVLCSNGCALDIGVKDGKIVGVRGRAEDRVNQGLECWALPLESSLPARSRLRGLDRPRTVTRLGLST